jgi:hypothetical protein
VELPLAFAARVFWRPEAWDTVCAALARVLGGLAERFDEIVVMAVDAVFAIGDLAPWPVVAVATGVGLAGLRPLSPRLPTQATLATTPDDGVGH